MRTAQAGWRAVSWTLDLADGGYYLVEESVSGPLSVRVVLSTLAGPQELADVDSTSEAMLTCASHAEFFGLVSALGGWRASSWYLPADDGSAYFVDVEGDGSSTAVRVGVRVHEHLGSFADASRAMLAGSRRQASLSLAPLREVG